MANEYKLKYTGPEIDEKLRQIDQLSEEIDNKQPKGNYLTSIPNGYVTETDLASKGYATTTQINQLSRDIEGLQKTIDDMTSAKAEGNTLEEQIAWLKANGDTTKEYLLLDGYYYAYVYTEVEVKGYTNLFDTNGSGYTKESDTKFLTNWIPFSEDDNGGNGTIYHFKGLSHNANYTNPYKFHFAKDSNGTDASALAYTTNANKTPLQNASYDSSVKIVQHNPIANGIYKYIQFEIREALPSNLIITANEDIVGQEGGITSSYAWVNTGRTNSSTNYESRIVALEEEIEELQETILGLQDNDIVIPSYYENHINQKIGTIKALQDEGGKDCFSFIVMSDIHYPQNSKNSPILAKKIMEECNIKYTMALGDLQSRGSHSTKANAENEWLNIKEMFKPIQDSVLFQKGNHDGSWGNTLNGVTYPYNFTNEEIYNRVYAPTYKYHNVITDESETGYYIDDTSRKVRYIMLNSHCNEYALNDDGSAKYSNMKNCRFTQSQYDMVIEALTSMKDNWSVCVLAHVPIVEAYQEVWGGANSDFILMRNLLKAYKNKTSYNASWNGTNGYDNISVNVDFTNAKGDFVGYFSGHAHNDYLYDNANYGIDIITTRCDGKEENNSTLLAERVNGTITEQSFDVFTINTKTKKIYATKIGCGSDREISY